jgi:hypothetical protein
MRSSQNALESEYWHPIAGPYSIVRREAQGFFMDRRRRGLDGCHLFYAKPGVAMEALS